MLISRRQSRPLAITCRSCGATLSAESRFCSHCGAPQGTVCPACRHDNAPGSRFCSACGAKVASVPPSSQAAPTPPRPAGAARAERRQLTVMFCDLVGSTVLSTQLDPEDLREVIAAYHECVADTVSRFQGYVAQYLGDGALIYFGYPHATENDAERAIRAALAVIAAVAELRPRGQTLAVRVGIASGSVVAGNIVGPIAKPEHGAIGETPNLAARLQALTEPDTVVVAQKRAAWRAACLTIATSVATLSRVLPNPFKPGRSCARRPTKAGRRRCAGPTVRWSGGDWSSSSCVPC